MVNRVLIKRKIETENRTQAGCAMHLDIKPATFNQKLNGFRNFKLDEAERLSVYLNIPDSEFGLYFFST